MGYRPATERQTEAALCIWEAVWIFKGKDAAGEEILDDTITGATVSSKPVIEGICEAAKYQAENLKQEVDEEWTVKRILQWIHPWKSCILPVSGTLFHPGHYMDPRLNNAIGKGVAIVVLIMSNVIISWFQYYYTIGNPYSGVYQVINSTLVKIIQMLIKAYAPSSGFCAGYVFIPADCCKLYILGRGSLCQQNGVFDSALIGLGMGLGYTVSIILMSAKSVRLSQQPSLTILSVWCCVLEYFIF